MLPEEITVYIFLLTGAILSRISRKLTNTASITAGFVGLLVYKGAGITGFAMLITFFVCGTIATGWQIKTKQMAGFAEKESNRRTAGQVIANGGVAAILGGTAWFLTGYTPIIRLMIAGSLAAATADTLSSELGSLYGQRFYDIISFKRALPGPDGVISLEGTLIGVAGAALIAIVYAVTFGFNYFGWIIIAGATGNLVDSLLGAVLERRGIIGNNAVNFLNTCTGASVCLLLQYLFSK
jgi:uncharacterized protein (TIGR00297 family)